MGKVLLQTRKFNVEQWEYDLPGRGTVRRELVIHPGAVCIVPLLNEQTVILIRNYRFSVQSELLELPAGTLEPPEPPETCAARELEEETGYRAGRIEALGRFYTSPGIINELMHVFVARDLTAGPQRLEATEQISVQPMALDDALAACHDGRIVDGKTIAALMIYHYRQKETA